MTTLERVSLLLSYDPDSGLFRWKPRAVEATQEYYGFKRFEGKIAGRVRTGTGYVVIGLDKTFYYAHRLAWLLVTGDWPDGMIDHIDGDPSNNRFENLRCVDATTNARNCAVGTNNKSGILGVFYAKKERKWTAQIRVDGKPKHLGYFITKEAAAAARAEADKEYGFHPNHGRLKAHADAEGEAA